MAVPPWQARCAASQERFALQHHYSSGLYSSSSQQSSSDGSVSPLSVSRADSSCSESSQRSAALIQDSSLIASSPLQDDLESLQDESMDEDPRMDVDERVLRPCNPSEVRGLDELPRVSKRKNREEIAPSYKADCLNIRNLVQWLDYHDFRFADNVASDHTGDSVDESNNAAFYLIIGEGVLYDAIANLTQSPRKFIKYVYGKKPSGVSGSRGMQCRQLLLQMQVKLETFMQMIFELYDVGLGTMLNKGQDIGWSPASLAYRTTLVLRYLLQLVHGLDRLYTENENIPKEVDVIPDGPFLSLLDTTHEVFCPESIALMPLELIPHYAEGGLFLLWPDMPIGEYSQFQIYEQFATLSANWGRLDPSHPEIAVLMDALEIRLAELSALGWSRVINQCDVSLTTPLDMLPEFVAPGELGGVFDITSVVQPVDAYDAIAVQDRRLYTLDRRYLVQVLGMVVQMRGYSMVMQYHISAMTHIANDRIRQELDMLTLCAFETLQPRHHGPSPMSFQDFCSYTYKKLVEHRDMINDDKYRANLAAAVRWKQYPLGLDEQYACVKRNLFVKAKGRTQIENDCVPRPFLTHQSERWGEAKLQMFEHTPLFSEAAASLALFMNVQNAAFVLQGHGLVDWVQEYLVQEHQWDKLSHRIQSDPSPFIYQSGNALFLRRNVQVNFDPNVRSRGLDNLMIPMTSAIAAFTAWVMVMIVDLSCTYSADQKKVYCPHWIQLMEKVIEEYRKDHGAATIMVDGVAVDALSSDSDSDNDVF